MVYTQLYPRQHFNGDYWQMPHQEWIKGPQIREYLEKHDFQYNKSSNLERFKYLHTRAIRGLLSYEKRTAEELRSFCKQRSIQAASGGKRKKNELIELLEHEDEHNAVFSRFLDLPPELRVIVYDFYMDSLSLGGVESSRDEIEIRSPDLLAPPPLTRACRLLRQETLPMFFDVFRLQLVCHTTTLSAIPKIMTAPSHLIEMVRNISIRNGLHRQQHMWSCLMSWDVDFPTSERAFRVHASENIPALYKHLNQSILEKLNTLLDDRSKSGKKMRLSAVDNTAYPKVFQDAWTDFSASI